MNGMAEDILIVDDEADIRLLLAGLLSDEGYEPRQAANDRETFAAIARRRPALVILDIWLKNSEMDGLGILAQIKKDHPDLPVLMMSGHGTIETAVAAIKKGAHDFIEKPFNADRLVFRVERAIEAVQLKRENADLRDRLELAAEVVGQSPMMNQLLTSIGKVATTNSRVLITGPAGAGKEVAARLLHERSARHAGPLVILNCAILDPARLEIELFGREGDGREGGG